MSLKALRALKDEYQAKLKAEGTEAVKSVLRAFFAANPEAEALVWRQYTPYFNDGDPCTFRMGDVYVKIKGVAEDVTDYDDGAVSSYSVERRGFKKMADDLSALEKELHESKDALEAAFGDHAKIVATSEAVTVEEYSHD